MSHPARRFAQHGAGIAALLALSLTTLVNAAPDNASLYDRMGGGVVMAAISEQLMDQTANSPQLNQSFNNVDLPRLKKLLTEQLCALAGGPCTYSGDSMRDVHAGLNIKQGEFYGMVEVLRTVMITNGVALRERNELLALLAPMKRDVVTR